MGWSLETEHAKSSMEVGRVAHGLTGSSAAASLRKPDHTPRRQDDPSLRHHVLHVLLPSLGDGRDTSACAETGVTIA